MSLARSLTAEARLVERAKIVLACLEGKRNDAVGREFGVRPNTVGLWRKRFAATGPSPGSLTAWFSAPQG
ncbi:MAG TPA: helix-turn-helix domain-containing protein [Candidatus Angelobacter sp.]|nr:helix-turn-helix domain-containing protein [Candidatus Angelobacter sp.]